MTQRSLHDGPTAEYCPMSAINHSTLQLYLTCMAVTTLVVLALALFQRHILLGTPLSEIIWHMMVMPGIVGLGFGYLIATVMRLQRRQRHITENLINHERVLETELEERRRAEAALRRQTQELRAANQELESFGYSVSHDLRAPLRRMIGFSEALADECENKDDSRIQDLVKRIQRASNHMNEMINDLLYLSRTTGVQLQPTRVNLSGIAHEIVDELRASEPERNVDVVIKPGLIAHADAHLLRNVLENLIGNAWKFTTKEDQPQIEIGSKKEDGKTIFFVRDNGVGFDEQYADQMFLPFKRLHPDEEFEGSGIGLATVQRIVHRHGGWIRALGKINNGSEIRFCLNHCN